jgi:hypothetical protein
MEGMLKKRTIVTEIVIFTIGFGLLWGIFTDLFQPKYLFASTYVSPETEMWTDFYRQETDSVDVLYVGSSHVYNDVNPLVIYEQNGLTGFDLATSAQDMATAYFLIKEALRSQSPKCVVLDVYGFHFESLLLTENYKKTLDNMKWSAVKLEAVRAWQEKLEQEKTVNRLFTLLDFHTRWTELNSLDYHYREEMQLYKGYAPTDKVLPVELVPSEASPVMTLNDSDLEYLDAIIDLCSGQGMNLVLIAAPHADWRPEEKALMEELAGQKGLAFYDFNESGHLEAMNLDQEQDFMDRNHLNSFGAEKFSDYLSAFVEAWCGETEVHSESMDQYWNRCAEDWRAKLTELQTDLENGEE